MPSHYNDANPTDQMPDTTPTADSLSSDKKLPNSPPARTARQRLANDPLTTRGNRETPPAEAQSTQPAEKSKAAEPTNTPTEKNTVAPPVKKPLAKPKRLIGLVVTHNHGHVLARCLDSLTQVCDTVVVVDSASTDETIAIAEKAKVNLVLAPLVGTVPTPSNIPLGEDTVPHWQAGLAAINELATDSHDTWVLWCQPFEWLNDDTLQTLTAWKASPQADKQHPKEAITGYRSWVRPHYQGRRLRHGKIARQEVRLAHLTATSVIDHAYFEGMIVNVGQVKTLKAFSVEAEPYTSNQELVNGVETLAMRATRHRWESSGKCSNPFGLVRLVSPWWAFARQYWGRGSWLDGRRGLAMAMAQALGTFFRQQGNFRIR